MKKKISEYASYLISIIPFIVMLLLWDLGPSVGIPEFALPRLSSAAHLLYNMILSGALELDIVFTLGRTVAAFLIGAPAGLLVGWLVGSRKMIYRLAMPPLFILASAPPIVFFSIMLLWFGISEITYIAAGVTGAFFPMFLNSISAVRSTHGNYVLAARDLGATDSQILRKVVIQDALPVLAAGARLAFVLSFIVVVDAELILVQPNAPGIGFLISNSAFLFDSPAVYVGLIGLALGGSAVLLLSEYLEKRLVFWRK